MRKTPCAILVVTASVDGHTAKVFEALGAGALDAVSTPVLGAGGASGGGEALLAKIRMIGHLIEAGRYGTVAAESRSRTGSAGALVVIGASAGGPAALATILGGLPKNFRAAIVVVQHVDAQFAPSMASWLNDQSPLPVRTAREGDFPREGTVLLAGRNDHLVFVTSGLLGYQSEPLACVYRPSIDIFFESVALQRRGGVVGVLLTGMGRDGAQGLRTLRNAGALTMTQDRASCSVYGMPKAAVELDAASEILPPHAIALRLSRLFSSA
jgi:two-component system response regulator WspF